MQPMTRKNIKLKGQPSGPLSETVKHDTELFVDHGHSFCSEALVLAVQVVYEPSSGPHGLLLRTSSAAPRATMLKHSHN